MQPSRRAWIAERLGDERAATFDVEPGPLRWLVDLWADAGLVRQEVGPMGAVLLPLRWVDLIAWLDGAGERDLAPVFRRAILTLSAAYASTATAAQDVKHPAPFDPGKGPT